jgi:16S rRNA (guanine1516-N2)-methyltransferase
VNCIDNTVNPEFEFDADDDGVDIIWRNPPAKIQFRHSFNNPQLKKRMQQPGQALVKACTNKQRSIKTLLDLTGGWGIDSYILACHGLRVTMLEQNEQVYNICLHSLQHANTTKQNPANRGQLELLHRSSASFLNELDESDSYDCIYLDPMFPEHKSGAKPAKDMQILQHLTENQDIDTCFRLALAKTRNRVVVKRPAKSAPILNMAPDMVHREKTIRFDVYLRTQPARA